MSLRTTHLASDDLKFFGFWLYLMTDLVIFAVLFTTFIVLRHNTFGGPSAFQLFHMTPVFAETMVLLTSSFTCSNAILSVHKHQSKSAILWFGATFLLGIGFLILESIEFSQLISDGAGPQRSGFLSSFFALVGTHGFHILVGLIWMLVTLFRLLLKPLTHQSASQMIRLAFFWHFLDIVWIFIFSVVYGMGHLYV
jgi:cytochrome o ubiquinol oxidase subunit III